MHDQPRKTLCELVATYGHTLCDDPRRCEGLLRDLCGAYKREIHALIAALKEGIGAELLSASQSVFPPEVRLARLAKKLEENLGLAPDVAHWAIESWGIALGVFEETPPNPSRADAKSQATQSHPSDSSSHPAPGARQHSTPQQPTHKRPIQDALVLSQQEQDIVGLFTQGYTDALIAHKLAITEELVGERLSEAQRKIGVFSRPDLLLWAIDQGLRPSGPASSRRAAQRPITASGQDAHSKSTQATSHRKQESPPQPSPQGQSSTVPQEQAKTFWPSVFAVLMLPVMLVGSLALIFVSAGIAVGFLTLGLWAGGYEFDQLGETAQGIVGILTLILTVCVAGLFGSFFSGIQSRVQKYMQR